MSSKRTRISTDYRLGGLWYAYYDPPYWTGQVVGADNLIPHYTYFRKIVDLKGRVGHHLRPKPVRNTKIAVSCQEAGNWQGIGSPSNSVDPIEYKVYIPYEFDDMLPSTLPQTVLDDFCMDAFYEFQTQMPAEVDIANFMYELREIADLIPRYHESIAKYFSGNYLNVSFGWAPFLGDLIKLSTLTKKVEDRLRWLRSTWGKWTRLGFYRQGTNYDSHFFYTGRAPEEQFKFVRTKATWKFRAGAWLRHYLNGLDDVWTVVRGFVGALHLNAPLEAVWQALPFSFVADWFGKFGTRLKQFSFQPFTGFWELSGTTHSVTEVATYDVFQAFDGYSAPNPEVNLGQVTMNRYTRGTGLPFPIQNIHLDSLTFQQQTLLLCLLYEGNKV